MSNDTELSPGPDASDDRGQNPDATVSASAIAGLDQQRWRNTRSLAAATHHAPGLSELIIDSYLRSPHQALPPEPGLYAEPVLRHALLARHRRGIRDLLLLATMLVSIVLLLFVDPGLVVVWLYLALIVSLIRRVLRMSRRRDPKGGGLGLPGSIGLFIMLVLVGIWALGPIDSYTKPVPLPSSATSTLIVVLGFGVAFIVLLADAVSLRDVLTTLGEDASTPPGQTSGRLAHLMENVAVRPHKALLHEVANRPETGNVLVHSGWNAFPGHGDRINQWSIAVPLHRTDQIEGDAGGHEVRPHQIYRAVAEELRRMQSSDQLAPGSRLRGLSVNPALVANSDGLVVHDQTPLGKVLLPNPAGRATAAMSADAAEQLADHGSEWARYFQQCMVAGWDSNLMVSTWFHVGCDERTLYLEWNAYALFPIAPEYQKYGTFPSADASARSALLELLRSLSGFSKVIRSAGRTSRRLLFSEMRKGRWEAPDYGSNRSIREIAANAECNNEFQEMDALRYITLLERRTLSAVHRYLHDRGFSTDEFEARRNAVINTTVINGGNFTGAHAFGPSSSAVAHSVTNTEHNQQGKGR